ncbi:MAG: hypothetical protein HYY01_05510 [Chloroflexi bacterium]|nr:hypothetical protein [Chloroflexota bacterium]
MATNVIDTRISRFPLMTLKEAYALVPDLNARDQVRDAFLEHSSAWCKFIMTYNMIEEMSDAVVLVHAPLNCPSCMKGYKGTMYTDFGNPHLHTPTTNLTSDHVVYGGEKELRQAIWAVDRDYKPELIVILTGCAPGLTLDDVTAIVEQAQPEVRAKLFHVPTSGFDYTGNGFFEDVLPTFADLMDPPDRVDREKVNILGNNKQPYLRARPSDPGCQRQQNFIADSEEMGRLIEGMGLSVHVVFCSDPYRRLRRAAQASVNTLTCASYSLPLAGAMQEKFGTPYVNLAQPLGPVSTAEWVRLLGRATGHEAEGERLVQREWQDLKEVWQECERMVKGKTALVAGSANRPFSIGRMCQELGMDVVQMSNPVGLKTKGIDVEHWLEVGYNPKFIVKDETIPAGSKMAETLDWLGLSKEDTVYFYCDFPPYSRGGTFDAANVARVDTTVHLGRHKGFPSRGGGLGYQGAKGLCIMIMEGIKAARRKEGWTFLGRLYGKPFDSF